MIRLNRGILEEILFGDKAEFQPKNFPKGIGKEPVCPHYTLIEACAELINISPKELKKSDFCGYFIWQVWDEGEMRYLIPRIEFKSNRHMMCVRIYEVLKDWFDFAQEKIELPLKDISPPSDASSEEELEEWEKYILLLKKKKEQDNLWKHWRKVVPKIVSISYSKLDDEVILKKVEGLIKALDSQVMGGSTWRILCSIKPE